MLARLQIVHTAPGEGGRFTYFDFARYGTAC